MASRNRNNIPTSIQKLDENVGQAGRVGIIVIEFQIQRLVAAHTISRAKVDLAPAPIPVFAGGIRNIRIPMDAALSSDVFLLKGDTGLAGQSTAA